ncbi:PorV/PorQ family protein [Candidatus Fermentibacteria bacterium]|nr:PorV/PorQ family protein [Candidatus Fermentibacteria bacterium]
MTRAITILLMGTLVIAASADDTAGFAFLQIPVGARSAAMGGAFIAVTEDPFSLYWNPSNLVSVPDGRVVTAYTGYLMDMQAGFIGWANPGENEAMGLSANYFYGGSFERTTMSDPMGTGEEFSSNSIALAGSYARRFGQNLSAGITGKFVYSSIDTYSGNAFLVDLGATYRPPGIGGLTTALVVRNAGIQTQAFYEENDPMPTEITGGASIKLMSDKLLLAADLTYPLHGDFDLAGGVEYAPMDMLFLRAGTSLQSKNSANDAGGSFLDAMSFGMGTHWNRLGLDYAYKPFADLGEVHRIGLGMAL